MAVPRRAPFVCALAGALVSHLAACSVADDAADTGSTFTTAPAETSGDGDGDPATGDGDGDPTTGGGSCGDGAVDPGEECDLGMANAATGQCTPECTIAECGDGYVYEGFEECDDANADNSDDCISDCKLAVCGDGFVHEGVEECDDGNDDEADGCSSQCTPGVCGDGVIQQGEQCDDGNDNTADECPACQFAFCGDGFVQAGVEICDDGNTESNDACTHPFCIPAACGDGIVWQGMEECDDGNDSDNDACPTSCTVAYCGDGFFHEGVEECDDGNDVDDDTCTNDCISNGVFWSGDFTQGQDGEASCGPWNDFRMQLQQFNNFTYVAIYGSNDPMGVSCQGAAANTICQALASGQAMMGVACDGRTWNVGNCGVGVELNAQGNGVCACTDPGYTARPCINQNNPNWGGVDTDTCNGPNQTIEVVCQ